MSNSLGPQLKLHDIISKKNPTFALIFHTGYETTKT